MKRCLRIPKTLHIAPTKLKDVIIPMAGLDPGTNTFQTLYDNSDKVSKFGFEKPKNICLFQELVAEYLTEEYEYVFLPKFNVKSFWNHKRFHDIMTSNHPGTIDVNEHLTSQICSNCGRIKKCGKVYRCKCGNVMDRDSNAAKNILNRGISAHPSHVGNQFEGQDFDLLSYLQSHRRF
jgi:hypothetical protein